MQDFLNPKSMMTPAAAAATMMFIVNGLGAAFPELSLRLVALVVSFLIGSIVFMSKSPAVSAVWAKGVYWVLNSLIIFAFGFASNNYVAEARAQPQGQAVSQTERARITDWLMPPAYADEQAHTTNSSKQPSAKAAREMRKEDVEAQLKVEQQKNEELAQRVKALEAAQAKQKENVKSSSQTGVPKPQPERRFFQKW